MTTPTTSEYMKFANLQLAAEALYEFDATLIAANLKPGDVYAGQLSPANLELGNRHASRFAPTEILLDKLTTDWVVVEHKSNTSTGFSGTLFKNQLTNELVLSLRSTEFIDDAARDNEATNKREIAELGWAFGQIGDMWNWVKSLDSTARQGCCAKDSYCVELACWA